MLSKKIQIRPFHIWWLGIILFGLSLLVWIISIVLLILNGGFTFSFNWYYIKCFYLPLFAASVGFCVPVVCLRVSRRTPARVWGWIFVAYLIVMLSWGIVDIRYENYQMGGHRYPNGPIIDGHKYYFHYYITWYFLPYKLIEKGVDG